MFIYLVTNKVNGKRYVGQTTVSVQSRWTRHCWASAVVKNMPIATAIKKYGKENFTVETLAECASQEALDAAELHFATELNTFSPHGYNLRAGRGRGSVSAEFREKMRQAALGKKASPETRRRLSQVHLGVRQTAETRQKLSEHNKGKRASDLCYQRSVEATAKTYELVNPTGYRVCFTNMRKLCRQHGLSPHKMSEVVNGKRTQHKGWRLP